MRIPYVFLSIIAAMHTAPLLAQTSSPPFIVKASPPIFSPSSADTGSVKPVYPVAITLSLGATTLWSGTLNVGRKRGGGRVSISDSVDSGDGCKAGLPSEGRSDRQIDLSLNEQSYGSDDVRVQLSARYTRPATDQKCGGLRTVSIEQSFDWADGTTKRFDGDGGLRVTLTRR